MRVVLRLLVSEMLRQLQYLYLLRRRLTHQAQLDARNPCHVQDNPSALWKFREYDDCHKWTVLARVRVTLLEPSSQNKYWDKV
jgi:hypothetical protein